MDEFFFEPIGSILSNFQQVKEIWGKTSTKREVYFNQISLSLRGESVVSDLEMREYLVLIKSLDKVLDLRNLYVERLKSSSIKLVQYEFVVEFVFSSKSSFKQFGKIARRYWIRKDMHKVYHFDLDNNNQRVGAGGFGDVRMVKHRQTKETLALKSVYKKKVKNKRSSGNSMRYD
jgi:hypothetical protein